jgi:hypothetical protein
MFLMHIQLTAVSGHMAINKYHCTGIVTAARAVYRAGKAMAAFLHST